MSSDIGLLIQQLVTLVALLVLVAFDLYCIRDILRKEEYEVSYFPRMTWVLICIVSTPLGGLAYLLYGRVR